MSKPNSWPAHTKQRAWNLGTVEFWTGMFGRACPQVVGRPCVARRRMGCEVRETSFLNPKTVNLGKCANFGYEVGRWMLMLVAVPDLDSRHSTLDLHTTLRGQKREGRFSELVRRFRRSAQMGSNRLELWIGTGVNRGSRGRSFFVPLSAPVQKSSANASLPFTFASPVAEVECHARGWKKMRCRPRGRFPMALVQKAWRRCRCRAPDWKSKLPTCHCS
jgi:hypothetical protein